MWAIYRDLRKIIFLVTLFLYTNLMSQVDEYLLKAGYIEKYTHFIEWPDVDLNNDER